jgi:hypothetical protein
MEWIGWIWLTIWTSGGLLWTRYWTFGFRKMLGSPWGTAQLAAPQEGLSSVSKHCFRRRGGMARLTVDQSNFNITPSSELNAFLTSPLSVMSLARLFPFKFHHLSKFCSLKHELPSLARTLGSWTRIPLQAWIYLLCGFILCCSVCS